MSQILLNQQEILNSRFNQPTHRKIDNLALEKISEIMDSKLLVWMKLEEIEEILKVTKETHSQIRRFNEKVGELK